jgi:prepilin-type N-terminal cleavage/methylation domain-containing protein
MRRSSGRSGQSGFTLIEILIAMLVAMVGLLGTVAIQQSGMNAAANVNDAQIAMRLASTALEQFNTRRTVENPFVDMLAGVAWTPWGAEVRPGRRPTAGPLERG